LILPKSRVAPACRSKSGFPILLCQRDNCRLTEQRSLEAALADLRAQYEKRPSGELARMIEQLEAEIAIRKQPPKQES
jgi:hypothetical protein